MATTCPNCGSPVAVPKPLPESFRCPACQTSLRISGSKKAKIPSSPNPSLPPIPAVPQTSVNQAKIETSKAFTPVDTKNLMENKTELAPAPASSNRQLPGGKTVPACPHAGIPLGNNNANRAAKPMVAGTWGGELTFSCYRGWHPSAREKGSIAIRSVPPNVASTTAWTGTRYGPPAWFHDKNAPQFIRCFIIVFRAGWATGHCGWRLKFMFMISLIMFKGRAPFQVVGGYGPTCPVARRQARLPPPSASQSNSTMARLTKRRILRSAFSGESTAVAFSPDSKVIATAEKTGEKGRLRFWDVEERRVMKNPQPIEIDAPVISVAFSFDGRLLATSNGGLANMTIVNAGDKKIYVYRVTDGHLEKLEGHPESGCLGRFFRRRQATVFPHPPLTAPCGFGTLMKGTRRTSKKKSRNQLRRAPVRQP